VLWIARPGAVTSKEFTLMSKVVIHALIVGLGSLLAVPGVFAQSCKDEVNWMHEHATEDSGAVTTDIKGTRATRITVCRAPEAPAPELKVEVVFPGSHTPRPLPEGQCTDTLAKWAIVRSQRVKGTTGAAKVMGTYQVCKE